MGNNPSVRRFKADMQDLDKQMRQNLHETLLLQADELVQDIRDAIEHDVTGHLKASVRKQDVSRPDGPLSVLVRAGGPLTIKRTEAGASYDYSLAEEFGTVKETPRPFFFSTVRRYRAGGDEQFRETFEQTIAANNELRATRAYDASVTSALTPNRVAYSSGSAARGGKSIRTITP